MSDRPNWRKSRHSGSGGGECVEVADAARRIMVRDTKQAAAPAAGRTVLTVSAAAWRRFTADLK